MQLLPEEFSKWKPESIEYWFNEEQGVLGMDGKKKMDPQVVYQKYK